MQSLLVACAVSHFNLNASERMQDKHRTLAQTNEPILLPFFFGSKKKTASGKSLIKTLLYGDSCL